jgi:hypothetical protein
MSALRPASWICRQGRRRNPDRLPGRTHYRDGINDSDLIVGQSLYNDDSDVEFLYDLRKNMYERLDVDSVGGISNGGLIAVFYEGAPYIYCLHKKSCPSAKGAIEIPDRWIPRYRAKVGRKS